MYNLSKPPARLKRACATLAMAALLCVAALAAAFAFSSPAQAQDETYVDLAIEVRVGTGFTFTASNQGTATAYGVTVDIEIADQIIHAISDGFEQKSGTTCSGNIPGTTCINGVWTVGTLEHGAEKEFAIGPRLVSGLPCCTNISTNWSVPARAVIKNSVPEEEERLRHDNIAVGWIFVSQDGTSSKHASGVYWLEASVDDLLPEAGDTVKFAFRANTSSSSRELIGDAKVRLKLGNGMGTPTATAPSGTTFAAATGLTRTWDWNIGTLTTFPLDLVVSTTLDNPLPTGVARSDLCLTAEMTARPEENLATSPTSVKICLEEDPVTLFQTGETDLLSLYHCVGETDYPCSSSDTLELLVNGDDAALAAGIRRHNSIMRPEKVVIQVPDPGGRVGAGSDLSWQTISDDGGSYRNPFCSDVEEGVLLGENWDSILALGVDNDGASTVWSNAKDQVTATGIDGGTKPGTLKIESLTCGFEFANADTGQFSDLYGIGDEAVTVNVVYIFGDLGTYLTERTYIATHRNGTPADTTDDVDYTATGSYIFHVGPIAELEVRDGDGNPAVPAGQRAFTIVAVNNGPDDAPAAQVTVTGLNASDYVDHSASHGTFDSTTDVWTIGELREDSGYYRATGHPLGWPTLTIITSAAEDTEITAAISNTQDYQVCIDSSGDDVDLSSPSESACTTEDSTNTWHTAKYYDYISENSTATIKARNGTGESLPGSPSASQVPASILVEWTGVDELNGSPVTHYEIEWSADGETVWTPLSDNVPEGRYVDAGVAPGDTRYYRMRAVNLQNHLGPWSQPIRARAETLGFPGVSVSETTFTIAEGESAEYTVGLRARPISNVSVRVNRSGDVSPNPSRLTFTPSNWSTPQTVTLTAGQDNDAVDDAVEVTHSVSSSDSAYASLTVDPVAVTVIDDDSGVSIAAEQESVNEGDDIVLTLTRTGNTGSAITVTVSVTQSGDYLASGQTGNRTIDLAANTASTTITVETENDTIVESPGTVFATVLGGASYFASSPSSVTVRVQDDDGPPGLPGDLAAEERDESVSLTWSAAPTGDAPVLDYSYRVRRSGSSTWDPDWTVLFGGSGRNSHTESGLTNGQEYIIQVRARNATGDGAAAEVTASPKDEPGAPDVTVESRNESLLVTWSLPDDGGRSATEYRVQWKSGAESFDSSRQATATTMQYTIPSLTNDRGYRVRVQAMNEVGWGPWSGDRPGTPTPRPATSLSITTAAEDEVGEPFRVTFTFTDEDHEGTQYGVTGFGVDDIDATYTSPTFHEFTLKDFREEKTGLVYSALVDQLLDGRLTIRVPEGAAQSTHDQQESTPASLAIEVKPPQADKPVGREIIWSAKMTVGDYTRNAMGYINPDLSLWDPDDTIGSLSDDDDATDDDDTFTYPDPLGKNYRVGEISIVRDWNMILFVSCPGIEGVDASFDLYLDDLYVDDQGKQVNRDHSLSFDPEEVGTSRLSGTIDGATQSCVEYRWTPQSADWKEGGEVDVSLVK